MHELLFPSTPNQNGSNITDHSSVSAQMPQINKIVVSGDFGGGMTIDK